jgi:hypothetical protein
VNDFDEFTIEDFPAIPSTFASSVKNWCVESRNLPQGSELNFASFSVSHPILTKFDAGYVHSVVFRDCDFCENRLRKISNCLEKTSF